MTTTINASTSSGLVNTADTSGILQLQTASTAAVTIDASQNVTLNSATGQLILTGNGTSNILTVAPNVAVKPTTSGPTLQTTSGTGSGIYGFAGNVIISGRATDTSSYGSLILQTGATQQNQWTFNNGATLVLPGGNTTATGTGIGFPAAQSASSDANTLDDYEEGTWTPNQGSGLTVVGTFSSLGKYTKIGNVVTVVGVMNAVTSIALSASNQICTNLPFTVTASVFPTGALFNNVNATTIIYANASTTNLYNTATTIGATTALYFSCTYQAS